MARQAKQAQHRAKKPGKAKNTSPQPAAARTDDGSPPAAPTTNERLISWLVAQVPEFCLSGPEPLGRALGLLKEQLGDAREVAARLVAAHGPRIRGEKAWRIRSEEIRWIGGEEVRGKEVWRGLGLRAYHDLPVVAALFAPLPTGSSGARLKEARALVRQRGQRAAAVALARRYGLKVFDELNAHANEPEIRELLDLRPRRKPGRPQGSMTQDLVAYAIAEVRDGLGVPCAGLLRELERDPKSHTGRWYERRETADAAWLRRRLARGRLLRALVRRPARGPGRADAQPAPEVIFLDRYYRDQPAAARLSGLGDILVEAVPRRSRPRRAEEALRASRGRAVGLAMGWLFPVGARLVALCLIAAMHRPATADERVRALAEELSTRLAGALPPARG